MFISFEGIAGSGKTTQVKFLVNYLEAINAKSVFVSAVYERKRRRIIDNFIYNLNIKNNKIAIMFLFQSLHAIQYEEVFDALNQNKFVIADRWRYSFFAHHLYQNTFLKDYYIMQKFDEITYKSLEPDICFLLDLPWKVAYNRYVGRENNKNKKGLNIMNKKYFIKIVAYYKKLAKEKGWYIIDSNKSQKEVFKDIIKVIEKKL